jgi:hypothetical protein
VANDAGWALDWFRLANPSARTPGQITVETQVAVRDSDGWVYRLGYEVTLAGTLVARRPDTLGARAAEGTKDTPRVEPAPARTRRATNRGS